MADTSGSSVGFLKGQTSIWEAKPAYLGGATPSTGSVASYLHGGVASTFSVDAYVEGTSDVTRSSLYAYMFSVIRDSTPGYMEGTNLIPGDPEMAEYDYIWLKSSDDSMQYKFRVLAQGYDDGTLEKAEDVKRTIGGGIDHSMGAIYKSWNPVVRVRASEPVSNYGTLANLVSLYNLNDPGGTPNNTITFIDHHGTTYYVHMVGSFQKSLMGVKVEGENAWSLVKLTLIEVQ